jgi:hypothetical protein
MMHAQTLTRLVKRPVKDTYGRFSGHVIGFSLDSSGQMKGVGVELGSGSFKEFPSERVILDGESIILLPEWREKVEKLKKNTMIAQKRSEVLDDLRKEGEVPQYVYEELKAKYGGEIADLRSSFDSLTVTLKARVKEIEGRRIDVERFLGGLKVQHRAKEIDEETYTAASETTVEMMTRDEQERSEILFTLTWLTGTAKPGENQDEAPEAEVTKDPLRDEDVVSELDERSESSKESTSEDPPGISGATEISTPNHEETQPSISRT